LLQSTLCDRLGHGRDLNDLLSCKVGVSRVAEEIPSKLTHHSRESGPGRWEKSEGGVRVSWVCHQEERRNVCRIEYSYLGCCDRRAEERETEEVERHLRAAAERVAYLGAARTAGRREAPAARRRH
jgi:hypothetical protein